MHQAIQFLVARFPGIQHCLSKRFAEQRRTRHEVLLQKALDDIHLRHSQPWPSDYTVVLLWFSKLSPIFVTGFRVGERHFLKQKLRGGACRWRQRL